MLKDFLPPKELKETDQTRSADVGRDERPPGKDFFSRLKDYLLIALLAVLIFTVVNNYTFARPGYSGYTFARPGYSGGCGGCSTASGAALSTEQLRQLGLKYYAANYGDTAVEAEVRDFGCHQEIYIIKDGQLILRLAYQGGELYEMPEV